MPRNLLLADDSITIQKVIGITFAGEDFTIVAVDNGEDAVRKARELRPDVILADVVMPKKNGYEVCETIKNDPELAHIPVLLLAGTFEAFDEARARAARADGHIAKPFESQALINKVRELLQGNATQPSVDRTVPASAPAERSPEPSFTTMRPPRVDPGAGGSPSSVPPSRPVPPAPSVPAPSVPAPPRFTQEEAGPSAARGVPPVLLRHGPGAASPTRPAVPAVPEARAPYPPTPVTNPSPPEAFDISWSRDELPGRPASPDRAAGRGGEPSTRGATPERRGAGDLDWAALGFETDAAAQSRTAGVRGSEATAPGSMPGDRVPVPSPAGLKQGSVITTASPARTASSPASTPTDVPPAPRQAPRQGGVPPASDQTPPQRTAAAVPLASTELLPFGEPIDLADLELADSGDDPGDLKSPASSTPQLRGGLGGADKGAGWHAEPARPNGDRVPSGPEALTALSQSSRSQGDAGEARLREALSHASREVIEKIAWEVIPTLAEAIIREHVERLVKEREK